MKTLIFVHIPKTGGRTLEHVLERQYPSETVYDIYGYNSSIPKAVQNLKHLSDGEKRNILLIKGHYQFGLHEYLPQACTYVTFIRNPIDRVVSHFNYVRRDRHHPLYSQASAMSLKDYVQSGISLELNNGQARLISGNEKLNEFASYSRTLLSKSKQNIDDHFKVVGIVESYDESLILMKLTHSWNRVHYMVRNVSNGLSKREEIAEDTIEIIRQYNEIDFELYNYAYKRMKMQISKIGYPFTYELTKLKIANHLYKSLHRVKSRSKSIISPLLR